MEWVGKQNFFKGDPERQKLAAERAKAIMEGTLPEFEAKQKAMAEASDKVADNGLRSKWTPEGRPEAAFLPEAMQLKIKNGDPRSAQEIAAELYDKRERHEEAA